MPFDKQILVFAENAAVRQTKEMVLKELGFAVVAVGSLREVEYVASRTVFDLAILGRTVTDTHKQEAAQILRAKQPDAPILEICNVSPFLPNADYVLRSSNPEDLAEMVNSIFGVDAKGKKATLGPV